MIDLSVVVPILDDDLRLKELVPELSGAFNEVVIIDGGESELAQQLAEHHGAVYSRCCPSRGRQIAKGVDVASKEVIWVLHVDAYNLGHPISRLKEICESRLAIWGRFDVEMPRLRFVPRLMNMRSRLTKICTGDQGMFFSRALIDKIGGFPSQPLMEDLEASRRLKKTFPDAFVACREKLGTSDRRWLTNGLMRTIFHMWWYRILYFFGVSPSALYRKYYGRK